MKNKTAPLSENMFGIGAMEHVYYIGEQAYPLDHAIKASLVLEDRAFTEKEKAVCPPCAGGYDAAGPASYQICVFRHSDHY